ncbi:hypothetical protein ABT095_25565 [Kitasatospora sp. NPDC002227]|uniref:hypothetical protein n=1 Tax=Kitasatospora sp. NPDC002227 TaxID=3154773 RepID=UPI003329BB96
MSIRQAGGKFAAVALIGGAVLGASPAFAANHDSSVTGSTAWSHGANGQVAVKDTAADSHSVYVRYYRLHTNGEQRLNNHGGSGTTLSSANDTAHPVSQIKACVDIQFGSDRCDGTWQFVEN